MKCARCGYHNLPGADACGQCGRSVGAAADLVGAGAARVAPADIYPPRARERSRSASVRETLHRPLAQGQAVVEAARGRLPDIVVDRNASRIWGRFWTEATAALVPGLGHLLQRGTRLGAGIFGGFLLCVALFFLCLRSAVSDVFLAGAFGLVWFSVFDAARHASPFDPRGEAARGLRALRLGLLSLSLVLLTLAGTQIALSHWLTLWRMRDDQAAPTLRAGDGIVVRKLRRPSRELRRGDVVIARGGDNPIIGRVAALPGEQIARGGWPVPAGSVGVWRLAGAYRGGDRDQANAATQRALIVVTDEEITGRVIARFGPPARRGWVR